MPSLSSVSTILIWLRIGCNYKKCAKRGHESFKEYTQRWRDLATQVAPPITEKEIITMTVDTRPVFYYGKKVGYTPSSFTDLVFAIKKIEVGLKRGKFNHPAWTNEKTGANEEGEDEGETHAVTTIPVRPSFPPTQQCHYSTLLLTHRPIIHNDHS